MIIINAIIFVVIVLVVCSVDLSSITLDKFTERLLYDVGEEAEQVDQQDTQSSSEFEPFDDGFGVGMSDQQPAPQPPPLQAEQPLPTQLTEQPQQAEQQAEQPQFNADDFADFSDGDSIADFEEDAFDTDLDLNSTIDKNVSPEPVIDLKAPQQSTGAPITGMQDILNKLRVEEKKATKKTAKTTKNNSQTEETAKPASVGLKFNDKEVYEDGDSMVSEIYDGGDAK